MNSSSHSLFRTTDLGLVRHYLKQAVANSGRNSLEKLEKNEVVKLVEEFVIPVVQQAAKDCSHVGSWKDEKHYVRLKIHAWFFMSWMKTKMEDIDEMFVSIGTNFYLEVVRKCQFEKFLVKCLSNVAGEAVHILIDDIARSCDVSEEADTSMFSCLIEESLTLLDDPKEMCGDLCTAVCHIVTQIARNVEQPWLQIDLLLKLSEKLTKLLVQVKTASKDDLGRIFTEKSDILEFNKTIDNFMKGIEVVSKTRAVTSSTQFERMIWDSPQKRLNEVILCLVCCVEQIITVHWRSLFFWTTNKHGDEVIDGVKDLDIHHALFMIFSALQALSAEKNISCYKLEQLLKVIQPYFQQCATFEERKPIKETSSSQGENNDSTDEIEDKSLEEKMKHALYQVDENLVGDQDYFEWLLSTEEVYADKRWLKCVESHAKGFVSVKIMKMMLDVLCVLQEFDINQGGLHSDLYSSLKMIIVDLLPYLSLAEQTPVVLYNFNLICLYFKSYKTHSLFVLPGEMSSLAKDILTVAMNKLVSRSGSELKFSAEVLNSIIQGCLVAPYVTLKELLTEAWKHNGYEKFVCELLQLIPCIARLCHEDDGSLVVEALHEILSSVNSEKQEAQYLKLVNALMQFYVHPVLGTKEPALVPASQIFKYLVIPVLTLEDDDVSNLLLVLNILMETLDSVEEPRHWILDEEPLQLLLMLLEMYQECNRFWEDWVADSRSDKSVDNRKDAELSDAWTEMNAIVKIVEENLVPLLTEDLSREPERYQDSTTHMQELLNLESLESSQKHSDWIASLLVAPLLQKEVFKECKINVPEMLIHLFSSNFNVEPFQVTDTEQQSKQTAHSFWMTYFKSSALSDQVFQIYLSKLKECYPRGIEAKEEENEEIIHALARVLPFSTSTQWRRLLDITLEMVKHGYMILPKDWKKELPDLPSISISDDIKTSEILVLTLGDISGEDWATSYVWNVTLRNYVAKLKDITSRIGEQDKFEKSCHLFAHLVYIACRIVPQASQRISILLLDVFNQCLQAGVSTEDSSSSRYLSGIISMIPQDELRGTMNSTMEKILSKNVSKEIKE